MMRFRSAGPHCKQQGSLCGGAASCHGTNRPTFKTPITDPQIRVHACLQGPSGAGRSLTHFFLKRPCGISIQKSGSLLMVACMFAGALHREIGATDPAAAGGVLQQLGSMHIHTLPMLACTFAGALRGGTSPGHPAAERGVPAAAGRRAGADRALAAHRRAHQPRRRPPAQPLPRLWRPPHAARG